jgi:hypothetical protein
MVARSERTKPTVAQARPRAPTSHASETRPEVGCGELTEALGLCATMAFVKDQISSLGD